MTLSTDSAVGAAPIAANTFGQTAQTSIQVTSRTGDVFRAKVYRCINVTSDPILEETLRSGEIYQVADPAGDAPYELAFPIRYHDEKKGVFALILPEELRHQEFKLRAELLQDLGQVQGVVPDYIRNFRTIYGSAELAELGGVAQVSEENSTAVISLQGDALAADDQLLADGGAPSRPRVELDEAWSKVEQEREQLARERQQLDEVRERIDRERARMEETDRELSAERAELGEQRSELQVARLNLEQKQMNFEQGVAHAAPVEATQVVTDDQFVEIYQRTDAPTAEEISEAFYDEAAEATRLLDTRYALGDLPDDLAGAETLKPCITRVDAVGVAKTYEGKTSAQIGFINGRVVADARVSNAELELLEQAEELSFFVQGSFAHPTEAPAYPFVGLLLAALDADEQAQVSVGWALDARDAENAQILDKLETSLEFHVALYDEAGDLQGVWEILAPLHQNLGWIRAQIERIFEAMEPGDAAREPGAFERAAQVWAADSFERLGLLRHNFAADSFADASTPAELSLAAGIVGYWSEPERFEYLMAHRSFPVAQFDAIQKRVVRRAVQQGIYIGEPLRALAVEMSLATDEVDLAQRLVSEFAEISVGLRPSDLNPFQEWENWDALLGLCESVGLAIDPDVLELAEASLKRAQDFQDAEDDGVPQAQEAEFELEEINHGEVDFDPSIELSVPLVARRSETTGVTYFLPDDALLDTFDDLSEMSFDDLALLLEDPNGRLEAAQMLVERFDGRGAKAALKGAENMTTIEIAALARFVEGKAERLEVELLDSLEDAGPSATYIIARALAGIASEAAIPALILAFRDPKRSGNVRNLARVIAKYGEAVLPQLKRSIRDGGDDASTAILLVELERLYPGLLARLAMDRSKKVRRAASAARES